MLWGNILAVAWIAVFVATVVTGVISLFWNYQLRRLLRRYGSKVLPDAFELASVRTPTAQFELQRYIFFRKYRHEIQPELRAAGRRQRTVWIIGITETMLMFLLMALIFWYGSRS